MTLDLTGPRAKVERGKEHLDALYDEIAAFFELYAGRDLVYHTFDGTWHVVNLRPIPDEIPPRWSLICGDAFHNLRSALDHLVWNLVIAADGNPGKWNSFPIYADRKDFDRDVRCRHKKRPPGPLEGIDPQGQTWAAIEQAQPYYTSYPPADPLAMLKALDDMDKHRTLVVQMVFPDREGIWDLVDWHPDGALLEYRIARDPLSPEGETELVRLRFSKAWPDPQVRMNGSLAIQPAFGNEAIQLPTEALYSTYREVGDLIDSFEAIH